MNEEPILATGDQGYSVFD